MRVDNGGKFYFQQYWNQLSDIIEGIDSATKNYNRLNVISHDPSIYVNRDCKSLDSQYKFNKNSIHYRTQIPDHEFENINAPVIYVDGLDVLEVNPFLYKKNKIGEGYRNKAIGSIGSQLIHLNPDADASQIQSALLSFNKNYCSPPLTDKEVINSLNANISKFKKGELDVSHNLVNKKRFWHPLCKLNKSDKISIGNKALSEARFKRDEQLILDTIDVLRSSNKIIDASSIQDYTHIKKSSFYKALTKSKKIGDKWHYFRTTQYNPLGDNMHPSGKSAKEKSDSICLIYAAIEELQDNKNKISQERVSDFIGLSIRTVKRNWLPLIKELVKYYNNNLKSIPKESKKTEVENEFDGTCRNILNPLTNEFNFEKFSAELRESKVYNHKPYKYDMPTALEHKYVNQ